ncbi:MAG: enoyl-CoA hydratase/isomerase family protein [Pseudomonadota bacterium]
MADVDFEVRGALGLITLNRPKALNALTHAMVGAIHAQLDAWTEDERVKTVAIQGTGDRAFCAGGDIRALYEAGRPGGARGQANFAFYADEYRLNHRIKTYPKPYVAIMDGIVMGGGVGVSLHGHVRIATERTVFAMPETGIGLFPDVGATYALPRLPGALGMWLALTGARLKDLDTLRAGVCDRIVAADKIEGVLAGLAAGDTPHIPPTVVPDLDERRAIDAAFSGTSVEDILERLERLGTDWAKAQHATLLAKSPMSSRIAFRQMREGAALDFDDAMRLEYRLARYCVTQPDFYEGVRAQIIDKDNAPRWQPTTLKEANDTHVAPAFAPLGEEELSLP